MNVRPGRIGPVVFLIVVVGCASVSKPGMLGPWASRPTMPIEGVDSAGRPLRLSDQRGKVVLVSFWHSL